METYRAINEKLREGIERNLLKNLGTWLGLLTLSRDRPIIRK